MPAPLSMCVAHTNPTTGKSVTVSDTPPAGQACSECRENQKRFQLAQGEADSLEARVRLLELAIKDNRPMYEYAAKITEVHDGDTVTAAVDVGFSIAVSMKLRLLGINAPEISQPQGVAARDFLKDLIWDKPVIIRTVKDRKEKYGRMLATILLNSSSVGLNVNELMIEKGHALKYPS